MKPTKASILSAILASVCCLGPVVLVAVGLGSLGIGAFLGRYHWFFLGGAGVILISAWRVYRREKARCDAEHCQVESRPGVLATLIIATLAVALFGGLNVYTYVSSRAAAPVPETKAQAAKTNSKSVTIPIEGMVCLTCEIAVESSLKKLEGILSAKANARGGTVTIEYDSQKVSISQMIEAINQTGYRAHVPVEEKNKPAAGALTFEKEVAKLSCCANPEPGLRRRTSEFSRTSKKFRK